MDSLIIVQWRDSATPSEVLSLESSQSRTSRRWAEYSRLLYCSHEKRDTTLSSAFETDTDPVSRFSSSSNSPDSSCESLDILSISSQRHNRASSTVIARAQSASNRTSRSTSSIHPRYADDHCPLITTVIDASTETVVQMAHANNTYFRALNSCYNHASVVSDEQVPDFLLFNQTLFNILSHHLAIEQQHISPLLHKPVPYPQSSVGKVVRIDHDHTFRDALHAWANYIHDRTAPDNFCGEYI